MLFISGDIVTFQRDDKLISYVVLEQDGRTYLLNPIEDSILVTPDNYTKIMETVVEVWRNNERVYPNGKLTKQEIAEFKALSKYFTEDTCIVKIPEGLNGLTSYIRITDCVSAKHGKESISLPSFDSTKYYRGLEPNTFYFMRDLMRW